jgi:hypothetical protein
MYPVSSSHFFFYVIITRGTKNFLSDVREFEPRKTFLVLISKKSAGNLLHVISSAFEPL